MLNVSGIQYIQYSTKNVTSSCRQSNVSKVYHLTRDMALPQHNMTLGLTENT